MLFKATAIKKCGELIQTNCQTSFDRCSRAANNSGGFGAVRTAASGRDKMEGIKASEKPK